MDCKNCNHIVTGNFCTHCGQNIKVDKINFPNFLGELWGSIFQINKGFFYSLKELFVRPGHSIKEYLIGKRKNHFKPIAYLLTLSTIYFLISQLTESGTFVNDALEGLLQYENESKVDTKEVAVLNWFSKNYAYTVLLLLPLYALASYLIFLRAGFNYLEHFVLNAYITGQQAIFYSITSILSLFTENDDYWALTTLCISISYAFFVFRQFFSKQSRIAVLFRTILTYVLYLILLAATTLIIFSI